MQLNPDPIIEAQNSSYSLDSNADKQTMGIGDRLAGLGKISIPDISSRTKAMYFHILFKALQVLIYMFSSDDSSVAVFLMVSVLIVIDFWSVKNVTGRLMVGLRWWTVTDETGKEIYYFENYDYKAVEDAKFSRAFWGGLISITIFWGLFLFLDLIRLKLFWVSLADQVCLTVIGTFLNATNTYFFYKTRTDHANNLNSTLNAFQKNAVSAYILGKFIR